MWADPPTISATRLPLCCGRPGASDLEVQLILGHADVETAKRLYAHLLSDSADNAAARVEQLRQARRVGM